MGLHFLVTHLFAPVSGPGADRAFGHLLDVWDACRHELGMDCPVDGVGLPTSPPRALNLLPDAGTDPVLLAAIGRPADERLFQAVFGRHHDVVTLSAALAPAQGTGADGWRALDQAWSRVVGTTAPAELIGAVRLYIGLLAGDVTSTDDARVQVCRALAQQVGEDLGGSFTADAWLGTSTAVSGFVVWEILSAPDDRAERRIALVAPSAVREQVSMWAWSRGVPEVAPFTRYLVHAAKIRYQLRVWDGGRDVARLRQRAESLSASVARSLSNRTTGTGSTLPVADDRLDALIGVEGTVIQMSAALERMHKAVEVARANMTAALGASIESGLFADDRALSEWFRDVLTDALDLVQVVRTQVSQTRQLVAQLDRDGVRSEPRTRPRSPDATSPDWPLTPDEREELIIELAALFGEPTTGSMILDVVGLLPAHRRFGLGTPASAWREMVRDMCAGRVEAPLRRLVEAALREYEFNDVFTRLKTKYGPSTGSWLAARRLPTEDDRG
ncbi:hypothetical protein I6A84_05780, partial [Frankia sp. CNm7]